jgi:CheY-like chemotaxis protein
MVGRDETFREVAVPNTSILIVEDEVVSRKALATLLSRLGYRATAVASAEEALAALADHLVPSIALIDLDLPGMSGAELISQIERLDSSIVPIVISASENDRVYALIRSRGISFLRKPLDFEHLLSVMSEAKTLH